MQQTVPHLGVKKNQCFNRGTSLYKLRLADRSSSGRCVDAEVLERPALDLPILNNQQKVALSDFAERTSLACLG